MKIKKGKTYFKVNTILDDLFYSPIKALKNIRSSFSHTLFWKSNKQNRWENETYHILHKFLDKDHSYIDIGAWIGPTVLYGAQKSKHCYAIEPDPVARKILIKNLKKNPKIKNVTVISKCIMDKKCDIDIGGDKLGDSMSSVMRSKGKTNSLKVKAITFSDLIKKHKINNCNFIKMDIEGAESIVLTGMKNFFKKSNKSIIISLHPGLFENLKEDAKVIVNFSKNFKYKLNTNLKEIDVDYIEKSLINKNNFDIILTNNLPN
ncbi:FkbM family methyltransferase [archaeon]|nr:FkbM family methyltransferase [archaeon]